MEWDGMRARVGGVLYTLLGARTEQEVLRGTRERGKQHYTTPLWKKKHGRSQNNLDQRNYTTRSEFDDGCICFHTLLNETSFPVQHALQQRERSTR